VDETVFINHPKHLSRKKLNLPIDKNILLYISHGGLKQYLKGGHLIEEISGKLNIHDTLVISIGNPISDSQNTRTLPYIKDEKVLSLYYSAADLMIYPTLADNFPLVVLESLSCGTPVISFDTGGIPEIITHQKTGYIGKYNKISDLVQGITFFLRNPGLLQSASIEARESIMKKFTQEKMISEYLKIYHHVWDNFSRKKKYSPNRLKGNISQLIENQLSTESRHRATGKYGN
jgi:glycosyltransferase involved in cell wall biosynthesis